MANFTGMLNANEIFGGLFNMIISQRVFGDNVKGTYSSLVDKARVDGTLYGDSKLYYATDILKSYEWGADAEAANLLELNRPDGPQCQKIELDNFRQIRLTIGNYLEKRAWMDKGAFTSFNSIMMGWMRDTKRVFDSTTFNTFICTEKTENGKQDYKIPVAGAGENQALIVAEALADLLTDIKDVSRDYNDYGYVRSYDEKDMIVVFNAKIWNKMKKLNLPVVFHTDGLLGEFEKEVLPARYFGNRVGTTHIEFTIPAGGEQTYRTLVELHIEGEPTLFPGDEIPEGYKVYEDETYMEDDSIAFKCYHKGAVPFMSAFEVGTSFYNPRALVETHFLTWGYNTLEHLKNYPFITGRITDEA